MSPVIGVVDDDASVRRALTRLLRAANFTVVPFASGEELLRSDALPTIDCLVLDVHLGGLNGFEVKERLKAMNASRPVVFTTADEDIARDDGAPRGSSPCLEKPVDAATLVAAIREALERPEPEDVDAAGG